MNRNKNQEHIRYMILSAMFAAMVYVMTAFVHIPTHQGYVHIGDGIIYLAASLLPAPYAIASAAIGAGLSDYLSGYAIWVLPTVIIKSMTAILFTNKKESIINKRNLLAIIPAMILCVGGYYLASAIIYQSFVTPLADVPTNFIQGFGSAVLFIILGKSLEKTGIKKRLIKSQIRIKEKIKK